MKKLLSELCPSFAMYAFSHGFRICAEQQESFFDNALVELEGDKFDARIIRDRGQVSIDLRPKGKDQWIDLRTILSFIANERVDGDIESVSLCFIKKQNEVVALIKNNLDDLYAFEKRSARELIEKIFGGSRNSSTPGHTEKLERKKQGEDGGVDPADCE